MRLQKTLEVKLNSSTNRATNPINRTNLKTLSAKPKTLKLAIYLDLTSNH